MGSVFRSILPVFLCFKVDFGIFSGLLSWHVARKLVSDHLDSGLYCTDSSKGQIGF